MKFVDQFVNLFAQEDMKDRGYIIPSDYTGINQISDMVEQTKRAFLN